MAHNLRIEMHSRPNEELVGEPNVRMAEAIVCESFQGEFLSAEQKKCIIDYAMQRCGEIVADDGDRNNFQVLHDTEEKVQEIAEGTSEGGRRISPIRAEANKLFAMGVFAYLETLDPKSDIASTAYGRIEEGLFAISPNITNYVGGINRQIELLAFAQRSPLGRRMAGRAEGEIIYHGAFSEDTGRVFIEGLQTQPNLSGQIAYLNTLNRLARQSLYSGDWAEPFYHAVLQANRFVDESDTHYLLKVASDVFAYETDMMYSEEKVFYDDYSATDEEMAVYIREADERRGREEAALRVRFPHIPDWQRPVLVASDACIGLDRGMVDSIYMADGVVIPIAGAMDQGVISKEQAMMLGTLYDSAVRPEIGDQLGISLTDISFQEQLRLLEFMSGTSNERYHKLCKVIKGSARPVDVAQVFLATEFGADYGDSILSIAEHATQEQAQKIFETINRFRDRTHEFAHWFHDYDPDFALATECAMNERLTDALTATEELAVNGSLHVDVAPHRGREDYVNDGRFMCNVDSLEEGIKIIENLEKSMRLVHDIISASDVVVTHVNENNAQFIMYRFTSKAQGTALLYIRPEGARVYDTNFEYGNGKGVEASISFIVNPTYPHHLRSDKDADGVSFRFDREGRTVDEPPSIEDRDPTREDGTISVDISSGLGNPGRMPVKIGRYIAAGNLLRAAKIGTHESLHHNTNYFNQKRYGGAGGFAKLAIYTSHMAEAMLRLQKHGTHVSRYRTLPGVLKSVDIKLVA